MVSDSPRSTEHADLQGSLAEHLTKRYQGKPFVLTEIALSGSFSDAGRLDVVAAWNTAGYGRTTVFGYEVKASRADLLQDVRSAKFRKYLVQVDRLFFAFPAELAAVDEIPLECGVLVRNSFGLWTQLRRAQPQVRADDGSVGWRIAWRLRQQLSAAEDRAVYAEARARLLQSPS